MKKTHLSPLGDCRKAYEKPSMKVFQMDVQHVLLEFSGGDTLSIINNEGWPTDTDTNPLLPW